MPNAPATVGSIPGLDWMLRQGPAPGSPQVMAGTGVNLELSTSGTTKYTNGMISFRMECISPVNIPNAGLRFANHSGGTATLGEGYGYSAWYIKASFEAASNAQAYPCIFNENQGAKWPVYVPPGGIVDGWSKFNVVAGVKFFINIFHRLPGASVLAPWGKWYRGGSGPGGMSTTEGQASGHDYTEIGTNSNITGSNLTGFGPQAVLGYSNVHIPSVLINGSSINASTNGDGGYGLTGGGAEQRCMENQLALLWADNTTPRFPFINIARGHLTLQDYATNIMTYVRPRLALGCSTYWLAGNPNDVTGGSTLSQIQGWYATVVNDAIANGQHVILGTILPIVNTTDGGQTTANQTAIANESVRQAVNNWLRGSAASSFSNPAWVQIVDVCAPIECNSSGVLTQNGGYWLPPALIGSNPVVSSTFTSGSTTVTLNDTSQSWTQDAYKGLDVLITSGALINTTSSIYGNGPTSILCQALTGSPIAGVTYQIIHSNTLDGTHPSSEGYVIIANYLSGLLTSGALVIY